MSHPHTRLHLAALGGALAVVIAMAGARRGNRLCKQAVATV